MNLVPKIGFLGNPNQFLPKVCQGFEDLIHHKAKASYLLMKSEGLSLSVIRTMLLLMVNFSKVITCRRVGGHKVHQ